MMDMAKKNKIMMLLFVASEAFFFIGLIFAYVYYTYFSGEAPGEPAKYLDLIKTGIFSIFLFSSSLTIHLAGNQFKQGNKKAMRLWLFATLLLGAIFLVGQGTEYARLMGVDLTISKNVFGSAFFTLTGFHGLHALLGLIAISIMTGLLFSERFESVQATLIESVSVYWHFVDAVWVVVFSVVYIGAFL